MYANTNSKAVNRRLGHPQEENVKEFNPKQAEALLREVFLTKEIQSQLQVKSEYVKAVIQADCISQVQKERMEGLPKMKTLKTELERKFPSFRFVARVKSLASIFGKMLKERTLADVFGITVIVPTIEECYYFRDWLFNNYKEFDREDRIMNPKNNGYRDLKLVVLHSEVLVEFIVQTPEMYVDAHTIQLHELAYPWKYHDVIRGLPSSYQQVKF